MPHGRDRIWRAATFLLVAWGVFAALLAAPRLADELTSGVLGDPGFDWKGAGTFLTHKSRVTHVMPGSGAEAAGLRVGDVIEIRDHALTMLRPGEQGTLLRHQPDGSTQEVVVTIDGVQAPFGYLLRRALYPGFLLFLVLAGLVAWRGARDTPECALALGLALYGQTSAYQYFSFDALRVVGQLFWTASLSTAPLCLAIFVTGYVRRRAGTDGTKTESFLWALTSLAVVTATILFSLFRMRFYMAHWIYAVPQYAAVLLCVVLIALSLRHGWRAAGGEDRQRIRWIALACAALLVGDTIGAIPIPIWNSVWSVGVAAYVAKLAGALLLVYATLRHRVVDFGFALNRATVFGATSVLLVGLFAALTALADRVLHLEAADRNWSDIAITAGLAVVAARVRKFAERWVERLLFRSWRMREQALRDFLQRAAHFTRPEPLLDGFAALLASFTGCDAAILLQTSEGLFVAVRGDAASLDADAALAIELRAARGAVRWQGGLALPMRQGGTLFGMVLLDARADGEIYRPDEIELLANVARQVGYDLQALQLVARESQRFDTIVDRLDRIEAKLDITAMPRTVSS